jgi:hypothetical protein
MKQLTFLAVCFWATIQLSAAQIIPSGTILVVQTNHTVSSRNQAGAVFTGRLTRDVRVGRNVALRSGTRVNGRVEASRASDIIVLDITHLSHNGRWIAIKTVEGSRQKGTRATSRQGTPASSVQVPGGTTLEFKLAQPLNLGGR